MKVSVIIPAYNPDLLSLNRVLSALKNQTISQANWELILVDNNSTIPLKEDLLSWHLNSQVVHEPAQGLTHARIRGIKEAKSKTLVFVDDDNVLQSDYLETAIKLRETMPEIGAFSGNIEPEFASMPPKDINPYLSLLAIRRVEKAFWGNNYPAIPVVGAGMVIDSSVATHYINEMERCPERLRLDRIGSNLNSFGDVDLAWCACDLGMGIGVFPELNLTHIIPNERISHEYILKLAFGVSRGSVLIQHFRGNTLSPPSRLESLIHTYKLIRCKGFQKRMLKAEYQGRTQAFREIRNATTAFTTNL